MCTDHLADPLGGPFAGLNRCSNRTHITTHEDRGIASPRLLVSGQDNFGRFDHSVCRFHRTYKTYGFIVRSV